MVKMTAKQERKSLKSKSLVDYWIIEFNKIGKMRANGNYVMKISEINTCVYKYIA